MDPARPIEEASWTSGARLMLLVAIALIALFGGYFLRDRLTFEVLAANREALLAFRDAHFGTSAVIFVAVYAVIVAFSLPGAAIASITGGFLFGLFPGTPFNMLAATSGAIVIFLAARWGLGARLARGMAASEGRVGRVKAAIDANQWEALFLLRLVPVVPFFVANLLPALLGVSLFRFVVTTALGIIPGALVYTSVGSGLGQVIAEGRSPDLGIIFAPHILGPILGLAALAALPILIKALRGKAE